MPQKNTPRNVTPIVPLYPGVTPFPRPIDKDEHGPDSPAGPVTPGTVHFTNHGGPTIPNPKLVLVYLGAWWGDTAKLEQFAHDLMEAGGLSMLTPYGTGPGRFLGAVHRPALAGTTWTDTQLQAALASAIADRTVPTPDGHTLYALCLPDGIAVTAFGSSSCNGFCGYHGYLDDQTFYAVEPATTCSGCSGSLPSFDAFTMVLSHEIYEACTDPLLTAWYADDGSENGDLCAWQEANFGPWKIQPAYTNESGCAVGAFVPPAPSPIPTTTSLSLSPSPATAGQPTQASVTVTAADGNVPTGIVTISAPGQVTLGPTLDAQGQASQPLTFSTPGSVTVSASYPGDATHAPSTAAPCALVVQAPPKPDSFLALLGAFQAAFAWDANDEPTDKTGAIVYFERIADSAAAWAAYYRRGGA